MRQFNRRHIFRGFFWQLLLVCIFLAGCSDSTAPPETVALNEPAINDPAVPPLQPATDTPADSPSQPATGPVNDSSFPFSGTITLDDYDWFGTSRFLGVIDITLSPLSKKRLLDGSRPRRHANGNVVYRQPCGQSVHRIISYSKDGQSTQITPCSGDVPNTGFSPTDFHFSTLSPDARQVAVEASYFLDSDRRFAVTVFDTASRELIAVWDGAYSPMWYRDGRLLLSSAEGFFRLDENLDNPRRLEDGLLGEINNPALHPSEDVIAFEYNQQIWVMDADGSNARELIFGAARLRYPAWSPDGKALMYLATDDQDRYHKNLYATDVGTGQSYALDLRPVLDPINTSNVPNGPLSWRP